MEVCMQKLIAFVLAAGAILRTDPLLVKAVHDGQTITVQTIGRVHLAGVDARRTGREREARERLSSLVLNRWVRLEYDGSPSAAFVVSGTNQVVNVMLVREGLARVSKRDRGSRSDELERAEADARASRRGLWSSYTR
jgi:endonuclease YncB( thermonuclease family)